MQENKKNKPRRRGDAEKKRRRSESAPPIARPWPSTAVFGGEPASAGVGSAYRPTSERGVRGEEKGKKKTGIPPSPVFSSWYFFSASPRFRGLFLFFRRSSSPRDSPNRWISPPLPADSGSPEDPHGILKSQKNKPRRRGSSFLFLRKLRSARQGNSGFNRACNAGGRGPAPPTKPPGRRPTAHPGRGAGADGSSSTRPRTSPGSLTSPTR